MGLINQDNRKKQDLTNTRTPEDVMRRLAKNVQITTDEVKGLTVEVSKKVGNNEIISRINQSAEAVTIDANKININGTISANGNFKVDTDGNMTCNEATMTNVTIEDDLGYGKTVATPGGLRTYKKTNDVISSLAGYETFGIYKKIPAGTGAILAPIALMTNDGTENDPYGYIELTRKNGDGVLVPAPIKLDASDGSIVCTSLTQTSSADKKKNFEKLENALDIVKDVDIYKYNMKDEKETDKKHIGFVIGDNYKYREEITSQKDDGVDTYSMVSVLWKAVQEQQKEIEELKKVIK